MRDHTQRDAGGSEAAYRTGPLPRGRRDVLDLLAHASRLPVIHGLLEVDVGLARRRLAEEHPEVSFTAFVVASVARTVATHPEINARRAGRRLVRFADVDMVVTAEERAGGDSRPVPHVVRQAQRRPLEDLALELRTIRRRADASDAGRRPRPLLERLPSVVRRLAVRAAMRSPAAAARFGPAVGVSSLGMFGAGMAWGLPVSPLTLMVTVGSIGTRPALVEGRLVEREVVALTLSFDHTVVDGAPAARFAAALRETIEAAVVLG